MLIATYYTPVRDINEHEQRELLRMFHDAWPGSIQCDQSQAELHPRFSEMQALLKTYPEVTPHGYRDQCCFRWLAFNTIANDGPILLLDYDVFPRKPLSLEWLVDRFDKPTILNGSNPAAVYLPDARILTAIVDMLFRDTIANEEPEGLHIGDNTVFGQHWQTIGQCTDLVSTYPDCTADAIHFPNRACPRDRSRVISETMAYRPADRDDFGRQGD